MWSWNTCSKNKERGYCEGQGRGVQNKPAKKGIREVKGVEKRSPHVILLLWLNACTTCMYWRCSHALHDSFDSASAGSSYSLLILSTHTLLILSTHTLLILSAHTLYPTPSGIPFHISLAILVRQPSLSPFSYQVSCIDDTIVTTDSLTVSWKQRNCVI